MENYILYITVASTAILNPGPGVTLTLTNALRYGLIETLAGILGVAVGAMAVATISVSGVGLVLAASPVALEILKYAGAAYLIFLGIRMWRMPARPLTFATTGKSDWKSRFLEGLSLQFSNPNAIFFFVSIFPQFITDSSSRLAQYLLLVLTFGFLVVIIHCAYAITASGTRRWLTSPRGASLVNKVGGTAFVLFGIALAIAHK